MATWLLPDNMADILPQQMRVLEKCAGRVWIFSRLTALSRLSRR